MSITDYGSGEMGGPKFIATCGDQRMSISLFKRMTVVRGAKRVRTMGRSSAYLGPRAVSEAERLASYEWEEGRHGMAQLGCPRVATGVSHVSLPMAEPACSGGSTR